VTGIPERIKALRAEARLAVRAGRLIEAYELASRATKLGADRRGLLDPINTESYVLVSELAGELGQPAMSVVYAENAFDTIEESLAADDPHAATVLRAMGIAYGRTGDYETAEELLQAACQVHEQALGKTTPEVATDLLALARLYLRGDSLQAKRAVPGLLSRARRIREANFDQRSVELAEIWQLQGQTIAEMYSPQGENDGVSSGAIADACETALRIADEIYGEHFTRPHPVFARVHRARGDLYLKTGRRDLAFEAYGKALEATANVPTSDDALRFASLAAAEGDAELTIAACRAASTLAYAQFEEFAGWAGIADKARYRRSANPAQQICLSLVLGLDLPMREKASALADLVITWRAASSRSERVRMSRLRAGTNAELVADLRDLDVHLRELNEYLIRMVRQAEIPSGAIRACLDDVRRHQEIVALETLGSAGQSSDQHGALGEVAGALASNAGLLLFQQVDHFDPASPFGIGADRFIAILVRPDGAVHYEDYGAIGDFEAAILESLTNLRRADPLDLAPQLDAVDRLYELIWEPVSAKLCPYQTVFVGADGPLSLVPFAISRDKAGRFLIESKKIVYVNSPLDLLRDASERAEPVLDALVVAGPEFGRSDGQPADPGVLTFEPLGAATAELESIRPHLGEEIRELSGKAANKGAIWESPPARYVHFATHGFFLLDRQIAPLFEINRTFTEEGHDSIVREIALVRSGLALAGANKALPGEAGILTALEIPGMDLSATELVTRSACETGVGTLETDEGVIGLRQAFELAGAHNLVMSPGT
jgi:tetratricopeptide (TPR) repeat protein